MLQFARYKKYTIKKTGIPIITHLHGGHTDWQFDGNPEFFYSPVGKKQAIGPQWDNVPEGFTTKFRYDNNVPAGNLWYHDHALGITRLNVYAGMAGFYFMRDNFDTGLEDNPLNLPAWPYEKAYAIQDRMFRNTGELFYPAFPGEPFWDDFITDEDVAVCPASPNSPATKCVTAPSALAEFFGDHMVVNGVIWPKEDVEPRNYRLHLLNGTDSRFMVFQFVSVNAGITDANDSSASAPLMFNVIGSDQGLASSATQTDTLVSEPGSRYDIVFDFKGLQGKRIILKNEGWDAPFGSDYGRNNPEAELFTDSQTDRIMAFDVEEMNNVGDSFNSTDITAYDGNTNDVERVRKVALFEGKDEYGRLQPLLGTAEEATDYLGNPIPWPEDSPKYDGSNPTAGMQGSIAWHSPTTENPALNSTEIWEVYNATGDAHPVHLHLVNFQVGLSAADEHTYGSTRQEIVWDSNTTDDERFIPNEDHSVPSGNGTYMVKQPVSQHDGTQGVGFRLMNITLGDPVDIGPSDGYVENAPKDMVTALPGQVTRIKVTFDKAGRYVWHCHILSHEDHEMMRVLHVGPGA